MKHDHHNPGGLRSLPFIVILLVAGALLVSLKLTLAQQFTEVFPGLPASAQPCVVWGDYDGDGDLDVLVAGSGSHDIAFSTIYKNTGGVFTDSGIVLLGLARASAAWGDFDEDGRLDLAMTGLTTAGAPTTRIYRNEGGGVFALTNNLLGVFGGSVAWGDYDGDGRLDLLVTGVTSTVPGVGKVNAPAIPLEPEFGTALRQALECSSDNPCRPLLNGACLDVTDKQFHYVVGTNGRVLFSANSFAFDLQKSLIIPDYKFLEWTDFMEEEPGLLSVEPGQAAQPASDGQPDKEARPGYVKLESGPWNFITEEIPGRFPDWKQAIPRPNGNWTRVDLSVEAMKQLVLVTPNLPGGDLPNSAVRLQITWNYLLVEGPNRDQADWTSISVQEVAVSGKPITFGLNRRYLLQALRFGLNKLEIEDALHPVVFADSNGAKTMVIMPVNLDDGKVTGQVPAQSSPAATLPPAPATALQRATGGDERSNVTEFGP